MELFSASFQDSQNRFLIIIIYLFLLFTVIIYLFFNYLEFTRCQYCYYGFKLILRKQEQIRYLSYMFSYALSPLILFILINLFLI